jgi:hypothetical protein
MKKIFPSTATRSPAVLPETLELQLPDDVAMKAEAIASKRGVTVEQLLRLSLEEQLARDAQLEEAVRDVLAESAELYRRLA